MICRNKYCLTLFVPIQYYIHDILKIKDILICRIQTLRWFYRFLIIKADCCESPWGRGFLAGDVGFMKPAVTFNPSVVPFWVKTLNGSAGIITQPVDMNFYPKLRTLQPAADCDMDSPAEENMLSDSCCLFSFIHVLCEQQCETVVLRMRGEGHEIFTQTINTTRTDRRVRRRRRGKHGDEGKTKRKWILFFQEV